MERFKRMQAAAHADPFPNGTSLWPQVNRSAYDHARASTPSIPASSETSKARIPKRYPPMSLPDPAHVEKHVNVGYGEQNKVKRRRLNYEDPLVRRAPDESVYYLADYQRHTRGISPPRPRSLNYMTETHVNGMPVTRDVRVHRNSLSGGAPALTGTDTGNPPMTDPRTGTEEYHTGTGSDVLRRLPTPLASPLPSLPPPSSARGPFWESEDVGSTIKPIDAQISSSPATSSGLISTWTDLRGGTKDSLAIPGTPRSGGSVRGRSSMTGGERVALSEPESLSSFGFGVDTSADPELALALRMSMEEEQNRLERERRQREVKDERLPDRANSTEEEQNRLERERRQREGEDERLPDRANSPEEHSYHRRALRRVFQDHCIGLSGIAVDYFYGMSFPSKTDCDAKTISEDRTGDPAEEKRRCLAVLAKRPGVLRLHAETTIKEDDHPQTQERFICPTCNKPFSRLSSLKIHTYSHTGEQPYKCKSCGKSFSVRSNLKRHEKGCPTADSELPVVRGTRLPLIQGESNDDGPTLVLTFEEPPSRRLSVAADAMQDDPRRRTWHPSFNRPPPSYGRVATSGLAYAQAPNAPVPQLQEADSEAIERLCRLGFHRDQVISAYFACDQNEELTANFLFDQPDDDDNDDDDDLAYQPPPLRIPSWQENDPRPFPTPFRPRS